MEYILFALGGFVVGGLLGLIWREREDAEPPRTVIVVMSREELEALQMAESGGVVVYPDSEERWVRC